MGSWISFQRFRREVSLWATFDHPNLLALCGVADIQGHLCAVSPWMANDTAIEFVKMNSEVDVVKILSEVAEGRWSFPPLSLSPLPLSPVHVKTSWPPLLKIG